jgi:glycine cleavage system H protein
MALRQFARQSARSLGLRSDVSAFAPAVATRGMSTVIEGLKYMASHEWAKVDGDTVTVGITDHAQAELGDVVYVELPEVGSTVEAKSTFGVVESVKAASDVYSPISGEVVAVNEELADSPGAVNEGAFTDGWMMKVKMSNPADLDALMDAKAYETSCDN